MMSVATAPLQSSAQQLFNAVSQPAFTTSASPRSYNATRLQQPATDAARFSAPARAATQSANPFQPVKTMQKPGPMAAMKQKFGFIDGGIFTCGIPAALCCCCCALPLLIPVILMAVG